MIELATRTDVLQKIKCRSNATLHVIRHKDPTFPKPVIIAKSPRWLMSEIDAWIESKAAERAQPDQQAEINAFKSQIASENEAAINAFKAEAVIASQAEIASFKSQAF